MKTKNLIIAMLAVLSIVSCRKEDGIQPESTQEIVTASRASKLAPREIASSVNGKTLLTYNLQKQLVQIQKQDGSSESFVYNSDGQLIEQTNKSSEGITRLKFYYDDASNSPAKGERFRVDDSGEEELLSLFVVELNEAGKKIREIETDALDPLKFKIWTFEYDVKGNVKAFSAMDQDDVITNVLFEKFDESKGIFSNLPVLEAEPGRFVQVNNPLLKTEMDRHGEIIETTFDIEYKNGYPKQINARSASGNETQKIIYAVIG